MTLDYTKIARVSLVKLALFLIFSISYKGCIMQKINTNTVVVYNYTELKSALENTTDTFVYLGSDITLTNGIKINASPKNSGIIKR